ncbi:MAG TPA: energy-coupling factor transporter ATPase [Haloplasmataceae bacterium]
MGIKFERVNFAYSQGTLREHHALIDINLNIELGSFITIIGHTGSGKSTLIQHMNALLQPQEGTVYILDKAIIGGKKNTGVNRIRQRVGLVFQFPEYQLFEETVEKDVMFGPMNFGVSKQEARQRAREAILMVGLDESILERSPLNLSGGQMRRVAIAGILAMQPDVLVLDEPTAGLDPQGQREMMELFNDLHKKYNKTIVLITHNMNHVLEYAQRVVVMNEGRIAFDGTPFELFSSRSFLEAHQLDLPDLLKLAYLIEDKLSMTLNKQVKTVDELAEAIKIALAGKGDLHVRQH